ncbi:hypothetical protein P171DRAFT_434102 [Karstenula rhodostoma CBS 690.94]|uniref:Uncharacterized protein n=1 Tax=Karstenula rhodostoma CBS 690.94 TaxID=1392251 RepID=A0A9P4U8Y4_9PLEO|nr:hypothetical protein P171DRAFT_434102 [Karstenula rhodostoma CBS 690.94]
MSTVTVGAHTNCGHTETGGANIVRADELSIEEYPKMPSLCSFTYPTCEVQFLLIWNHTPPSLTRSVQDLMFSMWRTYKKKAFHILGTLLLKPIRC